MDAPTVTFTFPAFGKPDGAEVNINFMDLLTYLTTFITVVNSGSATSSSAADVDGPLGKSLLVLVRDSTNGGTALILYENAQTPTIIAQIAGGGTTFSTAAPGVGEIQVKNRTGNGGIAFLAHATTTGAALKTATLTAET